MFLEVKARYETKTALKITHGRMTFVVLDPKGYSNVLNKHLLVHACMHIRLTVQCRCGTSCPGFAHFSILHCTGDSLCTLSMKSFAV